MPDHDDIRAFLEGEAEWEDEDNDSYDPDMTVDEALRKGLIAIIDSGKIGPNYKGPCGDRHKDQTCKRDQGHIGVHAMVVRWSRSRPALAIPEAMSAGTAFTVAEIDRLTAEVQKATQEALRVSTARPKFGRDGDKRVRRNDAF